MNESDVLAILESLEQRGYVRKRGFGAYEITDKGRIALARAQK